MVLGIGCSLATPKQKAISSQAQSISVKGSDTVLPLAQSEAENVLNENSGKSLSVTGGGSGVGIAALIDGQVNIATASREMTTDEIKKANVNGINPVKNEIAYDGIKVIVNPNNPISKLTFNQLPVSIMGASVTGSKLVVRTNQLLQFLGTIVLELMQTSRKMFYLGMNANLMRLPKLPREE